MFIVGLLPLLSCEKTIIEQVTGPNGNGKLYSIGGHAQKGPFIVGTDVTVSELNDKLFPTGRVFFSTILDDEGYFELPGVVLESPFIQIKVRGRYFSETGGYVPTEELTLYSLADITKSETINVNILTHLEKERVEYLVQEKDHTFESAKEKAQEEILKVFEWNDLNIGESSGLDLTVDNTGGAVLLAMSAIFENIEFITRLETIVGFKSDFAEDGTLDSEQIQNRLLTSADMLSNEIVRDNLETKYEIVIPNFEEKIQVFVETSTYTNYFDLMFPVSGDGKINLLRVEDASLDEGDSYAIIVRKTPSDVDVSEGYFYFFSSYAANPASSFEAGTDHWFQLTFDDRPECPNQDFCNKRLYNMVEVGAIEYTIPVVISGNGKSEFYFSISLDGIFTTMHREFTW